MRQTPRPGWHQSLADWAAECYGALADGGGRRTPRRGLAFAPFEAHRPERFHARPVALLVLSQDAEVDPSAVADAVELVRISTNGFRAVAFTDSYGVSRRIRPEWPVEQTLPEEAWFCQSGRAGQNWLDSAAEQLEWAVEHYGADHVLAPRDLAEAAAVVTLLAHAYNAQPPVLREALKTLAETESSADGLQDSRVADDPRGPSRSDRSSPAQASPEHGSQDAGEREGFRSGWAGLGPGQHHRNFRFGGAHVQATITVGQSPTAWSRRGTLLGPADMASVELLCAAHGAGWSSVLLSVHAAGSPGEEPFIAGVLRACLDALPERGAVVVVGGDESWTLPDQERSGLLRREQSTYGRWRVEVPGVAALRFSGSEAQKVFGRLAGILPA